MMNVKVLPHNKFLKMEIGIHLLLPWYQSIEFITALRRLDKPAWLLSYDGEAHGIVNRANRKDFTTREM